MNRKAINQFLYQKRNKVNTCKQLLKKTRLINKNRVFK